MLCGVLFLGGLVCVGLCLAQLGSYSPAGGRVVVRGVWWFITSLTPFEVWSFFQILP
jgi:hypothetical protein